MKGRRSLGILIPVLLLSALLAVPPASNAAPQGKVIKAKKLTYDGMKYFYGMVGWGALPVAQPEGGPPAGDMAQYTKITFVLESTVPFVERGGSETGKLVALVEPPGGAAKPQVITTDTMTYLTNHVWFSPSGTSMASLFGNTVQVGRAPGSPVRFDLYTLDMALSGSTIATKPKRLLWSSKTLQPSSPKAEVYPDYPIPLTSGGTTVAFGVGWYEYEPEKGGGPRTWQGAVMTYAPAAEGGRLGVFYDLAPPGGLHQTVGFGHPGADAGTNRVLPAMATFYKQDKEACPEGYTYYMPDRTTLYSYAWKDPTAVQRPAAALKPKAIQTSQEDRYDPFRDVQFLEGYGDRTGSAQPATYMLYAQYTYKNPQPGDLDMYEITYWIQALDAKGAPVGSPEPVSAPEWDHRLPPNPRASVTSYWERISLLKHTRDRRYIGVQGRTLKRTSSESEVSGDQAAPANTELEVNIIVLDPSKKAITETGSVTFPYGEGDYIANESPQILVAGDELRAYFSLTKAKTYDREGYTAKGKLSDFLPPTE